MDPDEENNFELYSLDSKVKNESYNIHKSTLPNPWSLIAGEWPKTTELQMCIQKFKKL